MDTMRGLLADDPETKTALLLAWASLVFMSDTASAHLCSTIQRYLGLTFDEAMAEARKIS